MSEKCVTTNYTKCDPTDKIECVGEKNVNFVYGIDVGGNYRLFYELVLYLSIVVFVHFCKTVSAAATHLLVFENLRFEIL